MWENRESIYYEFLEFYANKKMMNKTQLVKISIFIEQVKQIAEDTKFLWGRRDDESCLDKLKDNLNSTSLAEYCGIFSR